MKPKIGLTLIFRLNSAKPKIKKSDLGDSPCVPRTPAGPGGRCARPGGGRAHFHLCRWPTVVDRDLDGSLAGARKGAVHCLMVVEVVVDVEEVVVVAVDVVVVVGVVGGVVGPTGRWPPTRATLPSLLIPIRWDDVPLILIHLIRWDFQVHPAASVAPDPPLRVGGNTERPAGRGGRGRALGCLCGLHRARRKSRRQRR